MTTIGLDLAWVAGLFEGEGCIQTPAPRGRGIVLSLSSTDEDVVRRCQRLTKKGTIHGPYQPRYHQSKQVWRWDVVRRAETARLLMEMFPLLGERRQTRALAALQHWARPKRKPGPKRGDE